MIQYAVCHIQRGNSNGSGLSTHIERQTKSGKPFIPQNADPSRTHLNRELLSFPDGVKIETVPSRTGLPMLDLNVR